MLCPLCQVELKMTEREGVELDYCPKCRGMWLDRGELDKLLIRIERQPPEYADEDSRYSSRREARPVDAASEYRSEDRYEARPQKRESLLSRLFDWD